MSIFIFIFDIVLCFNLHGGTVMSKCFPVSKETAFPVRVLKEKFPVPLSETGKCVMGHRPKIQA